jgi:hypothetical protein
MHWRRLNDERRSRWANCLHVAYLLCPAMRTLLALALVAVPELVTALVTVLEPPL